MLASTAVAQSFVSDDREAWRAFVGPTTGAEDFSSFVADTSLQYGPVAIAVGSIQRASGAIGALNFIDTFPYLYLPGVPHPHNDTTHAWCTVNSDPQIELRIDLSPRIAAFGAELRGAAPWPGEGVALDVRSGGALLFSVDVPWGNGPFFGFASPLPFDSIVLRAQMALPGVDGDVFTLDEIEVVESPCAAPPIEYCTAGTSSAGCVASIASSGFPSATAGAGFTILVSGADGQRSGTIFYGVGGRAALPWWPSNPSLLCVQPPVRRTPLLSSGGTAGGCDGTLALDWNAFRAANPGTLGSPFSPGDRVWAQGWYRDPVLPPGAVLTRALELTLCP